MALNPIVFTEKVVRSFLRYQRTAYPFADARLLSQITALPASTKLTLPWDDGKLPITYGSLPTQDAVRFVSFLVNLQSGRSKFAYGVATVGGRTHIGVVTKAQGFSALEEPQLKHLDKGFGDDF